MNSTLYKIMASLLLCFYIAGGALVELTHHDQPVGSSHHEARFEHHDCDGTEAHAAPEASHCLACTLAKSRVAIETHLHIPPQIFTTFNTRIVRSLGQTVETDVLHSGKRGPPHASV